ncbi:MAG: glycosyltransferase family 1 protein [Polyangia bacterium]
MRVGFLFQWNDGWLGGVNYLWNLLYAVTQHERGLIEPVLVAPPGVELHGLDELGAQLVRADLGSTGPFMRTAQRRLLGRDSTVARLAEGLHLDAISHSGTFGWSFPVRTVPWIPDLQHHRLPQNFSAKERALRTYGDLSQLIEGDVTIVSSAAAQADCRRYYGPLARYTEVLRFVSQPRAVDLPDGQTVQAAYDLPSRFLFLPNQFWRHKNHTVVVDAVAILARRGVKPVVVMTGKGEDYRAPEHYAALMARIDRLGLSSQLRHLGMVPFEMLSALMRDALAVINPSHFEGWSTTVEEARSLGKATLLSDIDVHREQAPPGVTYFPPDDAETLAAEIERVWHGSNDLDAARAARAAAELPGRTRAFAARYREIVTK